MDNHEPHEKHEMDVAKGELLVYQANDGRIKLDVRLQDETVWLTQQIIAELFQTTVPNISMHIRNIYREGELDPQSTIKKFLTVRQEGKRQVKRELEHFSLDMIISVGYRVNSKRATQFRQWATQVLKDFAIKGYVLDRKRLENGTFLGENYFERLLEEIREIRLSERQFYQKITDIYSTSMDYNKDAPTTREFFAKVQNKLHYAIHGHTAAELIMERADNEQKHMGLTSWENAPDGKIIKSDVSIAKNYLAKAELESLGRIVNAYLELAEDRAKRKIPMTMEDWGKRLDAFLEFDERDILQDSGKVTAQLAREFAETEFEKYRITQDRLFESDFDKEMKQLESSLKRQGDDE
jgi:hypothetical protein